MEEWLLVVSGTPTLRAPEGERELARGDVVVFREGPEGAHQVINRSAEPARVLIFSSESSLTVVHYPDSGKVGFRARSDGQGALLPANTSSTTGGRGVGRRASRPRSPSIQLVRDYRH